MYTLALQGERGLADQNLRALSWNPLSTQALKGSSFLGSKL